MTAQARQATATPLDDALTALLAAEQAQIRDPYPLYRALREQGPVYWHRGFPYVTTHAAAKQVFRDDKRFLTWRSEERFKLDALSAEDRQRVREIVQFEQLQLSGMNGEVHKRVRECAQRTFTPARMTRLGDHARGLANDFLDGMAAKGEADIVEMTYRLPLLVLMELLGAPAADADRLKRWGDDLAGVKRYVPGGVPSETIVQAHAAVAHLKAYALDLADRHRGLGEQGGLIGALAQAADAGQITQDELAGTLVVVLYAGHLTTTDMMGNGLFELLRDRAQWELLAANPALARMAVEETMRFNAPVQMMIRMCVEDAEIAGVPVKAGTSTMVLLASANRDPQAFEAPDRLDITRKRIDHVSFGFGIHFCLGAALARLEAQAVFETLCRRFPEARLAVDAAAIEWNAHPMFHGLTRLPVALGRDRGRTA